MKLRKEGKYSEAKSMAERQLDDSVPKIKAPPTGDDSGEWGDLPEQACRKDSKLSNKLSNPGKL
jgi:hypothetical protein